MCMLVSFMDDALDNSKINKGTFEPKLIRFYPREVIQTIIDMFKY